MAGIGHRGFMGRKKEPVGLPFIFSVTVGSGQSFQLPTISGGTYDCIVDWGDENSNTLEVWNASGRSHTYAVGGTYDIRISGVFDGWSVNNYSDRLKIVDVKQWGILRLGVANANFRNCSNMIVTATDILNTTGKTDFTYTFGGCSSIVTIPNIESWDMSSATTLHRMFQGCIEFVQPTLNGWDTSNVVSMYSVFQDCRKFNGTIGDWDTSNVTRMDEMFTRCYAFNQDISDWDVSSVQIFGGVNNDRARGMFSQCTVFNQDISGWNVSAGTRFNEMFCDCSAFNQDLSLWDLSNATSIRSMFENATSFDANLGEWNISNVTNAHRMFLNVTLSTINYDALLIGWASQDVQSGVLFNGGTSQYTSGGAAEAARTTLINTYGWTITDGGAA